MITLLIKIALKNYLKNLQGKLNNFISINYTITNFESTCIKPLTNRGCSHPRYSPCRTTTGGIDTSWRPRIVPDHCEISTQQRSTNDPFIHLTRISYWHLILSKKSVLKKVVFRVDFSETSEIIIFCCLFMYLFRLFWNVLFKALCMWIYLDYSWWIHCFLKKCSTTRDICIR